ncbi:TonB-linked SusC/RagA family outer membrane protein [Sphingobacterium yanglingense]|uniref:TonB-linked SusC/RagA family outer membrane protein n=2 Tax=Sphingobacterium yanglingense TaxID=1437280 RepID=A0A4R6W1K2_9SPHI|nr:TonB-linked SusC/RagA family outer membrane protein [Sphingobacterium yanglingense]
MYKLLTTNAGIILSRMKKFIFIMKLVFTGWLLMLLQVSASTYAQKVSIRVKNASLKEVLSQIQKQTKYDFIYDAEHIKALKPINMQVSDVDLKDVLHECLKGQGFAFSLDNQVVAIERIAVKPVLEQQQSIKGIVMDESGKPLAGVSIRLKATNINLAQTNAQGEFELPSTAFNQVVAFSFLGYKVKVQRLSPRANAYSIRMETDEGELEEVVISTGIFKKVDKSFTGASTTVTAKELQQFGTRNLVTSLRNIDPSFNILESNLYGSDPNRMPEIQIRGNSSIPNVGDLQNESRAGLNTPLVVLDGFQSSLKKLLDINENDVESITILKDAAATAMYGSRGANGVIVITTKQPIAGKLRVSFGSNFNIENPDLTDYNLLSSRDKLALEKMVGYYDVPNGPAADISRKKYYNYILNEVNRGVETDWLSIPLHTSMGQRHRLRLEGGDNELRYSASAQYNNISGVMKGSSRNIFNGDIMLSYQLSNFRFRNNTQIAQGKSKESPYGKFGDYTKLNPYWTPYDQNGKVLKRLGDPGNGTYTGIWAQLPTNPLYDASLNTYDKSEYSEIINNTSVEWDITSDVVLRTQFGLTKRITQSDKFRPADHTAFADYGPDDLFRRGDYTYGVGNNLNYDGSVNLAYNKVFNDKHNIYAAGDFNIRQIRTVDYSVLAEGYTNAQLDFFGSALQYAKGKAPEGFEDFNRALGFSGNISYSYSDKYFTDFLFRRDGSSQFGSKRRFAPFWSFGLGWNIHEENFMKDISWVNRLKVRGSTGIVGAQNFNAYQAMTAYKYYSGESYFSWPGVYLLGLGNDELSWQQTKKDNFGIDLELWNRRLKIRTDIYQETTEDLVSSIDLPASNGFPSYVENVGRMRNRGFESQLTFVVLNNTDGVYWSVTGNLLRNKNKVLETSQALKDALTAVKNNSTLPGTVYEEGYSSNTIWVVPSLGIDPSNGKEVYLDRNGNPTNNWDGNDVVAAGSTEAKLFGNFSTMVRYKNFTMNAVFRYTLGGQQYNSTLANKVEASDYKYQMDERVFLDRWKQPGDNAFFRGVQVTTPIYKTSRFVQKENTLVLSNVNLQYDFRAQAWMNRMGLSHLNIAGNISEPMYLSTVKRERGTNYPFSRQFSLSFSATF